MFVDALQNLSLHDKCALRLGIKNSERDRGYSESDDDISSVFMAINTKIKNNTIKSIKIVCGGMAATPKIAEATEIYLKDKKITYENISKAKLIISKEFSPLSDVRGSKNYRTKIVSNLLDRFWNEYNNKKVTVYDF